MPDTFTSAALKQRADRAADAVRDAICALEDKAGYDPNQPSVLAGRRDGGRWTRFREGRFISGVDELWADIEARAGETSYEALRFVRRNRAQINRVLGGLQMLGGFGEVALGATAVTAASPRAAPGWGSPWPASARS
jgi:hypothetical protein